MQSDDDFQTTLSKWPFILGDVLLVAIALAIGFLGDWALTNIQVASCVISVALGCSLFVLPYIVEYKVRVREEAEDRSADRRIMQRHILSAHEQLDAVGAQIKSLELSLAELSQAKTADMTAPIQALEDKLGPLQGQQAAQSSQLDSLAERIEALSQAQQPVEAKLEPFQQQQAAQSSQLDSLAERIEALSQAQQPVEAKLEPFQQQQAAQSSQLDSLAERIEALSQAQQPVEAKLEPLLSQQSEQSTHLDALAEQVDALAQLLEANSSSEAIQALRSELAELKVRVEAIPPQTTDLAQTDYASQETEIKAEPEVTKSEVPKLKKVRSSRARRSSDSSLLKRAIGQKQDASSQAVSRIIESKTRRPEMAATEAPSPEQWPQVEESTEAPVPESAVAEPVAVVEAAPEPQEFEEAKEPVVEQHELEVEPTEAAELEEEVEGELASAPVVEEAESAPEPEAELATEATLEQVDEPKVLEPEVSAEPDDLFGNAIPVEARKQKRSKKSDTAVVASVFIGIGNKPFVRGSGAGLSWDRGVAMEFEEIGKWRWLASADLEQAVEIQLFRNDEDPDTTGKYTLEPGQQLDLSPVF